MVLGSYAEGGVQQCWADDCGAGKKADGTMSVKYLEKIWWIRIFMLYLYTERDIDIKIHPKYRTFCWGKFVTY